MPPEPRKNTPPFPRTPQDLAAVLNARGRKKRQVPPPAPEEQHPDLTAFEESLSRLFNILSALPAEDGMEFFVRCDTRIGRQSNTDARGLHANLYIAYGTPASATHRFNGEPLTYSVLFQKKIDTAPAGEKSSPHLRLELSARPLFEAVIAPEKDGTLRIDSHVYTETYVRASTGDGPLAFSGFRPEAMTIRKESHAKIADIGAAIGQWLRDAAPERYRAVTDAVSADMKSHPVAIPASDVKRLPLRLKKNAP